MTPSDLHHRIRESFDRQALMRALRAAIAGVEDGKVGIRLPAAPHISQQHGFAHAGAIAAIADSACGPDDLGGDGGGLRGGRARGAQAHRGDAGDDDALRGPRRHGRVSGGAWVWRAKRPMPKAE